MNRSDNEPFGSAKVKGYSFTLIDFLGTSISNNIINYWCVYYLLKLGKSCCSVETLNWHLINLFGDKENTTKNVKPDLVDVSYFVSSLLKKSSRNVSSRVLVQE